MPKVDNPVLLNVPDQFETERMVVRVPRAGDGAILHEALKESQPELKQWLDWAHNLPTAEGTEAEVRRASAHFILRERITMFGFLKRDGQFVTRLILHRVDWSVPLFEMGYWVRTSFGGQGYVTEAVRGFTDYTFTHLHAERLEIRCDARNDKSAAVARRCGYIYEGTLRGDMREPDDTLSSGMVFSLLRHEWEAMHNQQ
jgi:ribosomal-protein-serine acetyltransferase